MTIEGAIREDAHDVDQGMDGLDEDFDEIEKGFIDAEYEDGKDLSEERDEEADAGEDEDPSDDTSEDEVDDEVEPEDKPEDDAKKEAKSKVAEDDAEVVHTVDGKEIRATVRDVKRLLGQEAALTQRSMRVAEKDRSVDAQLDWLKGTLGPIKAAAEARWNDYKDTDLYIASSEMDRETFKVFRRDYEAAEADVKYVQDMEAKIARVAEIRGEQAYGEAVQAAHTAINDKSSLYHIEGWSKELYDGLLNYGHSELKLDPKELDRKTDPLVFKLLHLLKANADDRAKRQALRDKAKGAKPTVPTTTRVKVTAPGAASAPRQKGEVDTTALGRLKKTGKARHADAVFEAFVD